MKRRVVLTFPATRVEEPITYHLVKDFDIIVNILNADITSGREGKLLVELKAARENIEKAISWMVGKNIDCSPVMQSIHLHEELCIHCGSCSSVCFADALLMDVITRKLLFRPEKCIACEHCLKACPLSLFELNFA